MTNREIHDAATPHYSKAKRVGYFIRWHYDVMTVKGQRTTMADGLTVRYEADCTGTMPLATARKLAERIAASEGMYAVSVNRVLNPSTRWTQDENWYERYGTRLTEDQFSATVDLRRIV